MSPLPAPELRDTKERILAAALKLFAERGFNGTSLRNITAEAGVNLAAVNYHFGSKEMLIEATFARILGPINHRRLEQLDRLEEQAGADGPSVETIVEAFVGPALRMARGDLGLSMRRLLGHMISQPSDQIRELFTHQFREIVQRFCAALKRALPDLPDEEILWRLLFMVGAMAHAMAMSDNMKAVSRGLCDAEDVEEVMRRIVPFIAQGMRAPATVGDA